MGHSPRSKLLPVFYGGQYTFSRGPLLPRTRSLSNSPGQSPKRGSLAQQLQHHNSSMRMLRFLVMLGIGLLLMSLMYFQIATALIPTMTGVAAAAAAAQDAALDQQQLAGALAPIIKQQHQSTGAGSGDSSTSSAATPAGGFPAPSLTHLVLVAGHAVYTGLDFAVATKESSWFLEPYQQVEGEAQSFLDHIRLGVEAAAADPAALLLFSGGQTRKAAGPRSEGLSYWMAAEAAGWFGHEGVRSRAYTEEHARDSFENLLFSLCRFYEITGRYPGRVTAVSYTLKQKRFEELHRTAVRYPADAFHFIGTPIPPAAKGATEGEAATVAAFQRDPYGCSGTLLAKKSRRDPFAVGAPHPTRCPAIAGLLQHCGSKQFKGPLPWDQGSGASGHGAADAHSVKGPASKQGWLSSKGRQSSRSGIYT